MLTPTQAQKLAIDLFNGDEAAPLPREPDPADLPAQIGGYRIIRQIASGGMGTVYEAMQEHPHRTVALKVLRPGIISRQTLRRFQYEAEVLGRLQHPNIAQVHAAGTHDDGSGGVPYFVMEYLPNALPITEFAQRHDLSMRERIELFTQVCDAVHYGHQKGFIHRDLKPANILVTSEGVEATRGIKDVTGSASRYLVKVIDFGIARATDSDTAVTTMQTDVHELIGTLQYMSPEQCDGNPGELDVRSDVYSLGVVLYELLCSQLPYDVSSTTIAGAAKMIQQQEPARPSAITKRLRGDVETIVLKALEKDRSKRYQCTLVLADDIRRHLRGEPIEARKPTAWTKTMRWAARHPKTASAVLCASMVVITAAAIAVGHWQMNLKPHGIKWSDDRREVHLLSFSGAVLKTWQATATDGFHNPLYVRNGADGGGDLVLLASGYYSGLPDASSIRAYAIDGSLDEPAWTAGVKLDDMPLNFHTEGVHFSAYLIAVDDVFPEKPGKEVIAQFRHSHSSGCALCVFDVATGELLYRIWHDGSFDAYWLDGSRLIIGSGCNSEVYATERGYPVTSADDNHPRVVFAVRPTWRHISRVWTTPHGTTAEGEPGERTTLAWYWAFPGPMDFQEYVLGVVSVPRVGFDPGRFFHLSTRRRDRPAATAYFVVDENGVIVSRECSDSWKNDPQAPPTSVIDAIEPVPLPPVATDARPPSLQKDPTLIQNG